MKKILAFILLIVLAFLFVGCANNQAINNIDNEKLQDNNQLNQNDDLSEVLPITLKEFGYSMHDEYLYYSIILHNPNIDKAIKCPSFRITARDANGGILTSEEQTLSIIYPEQDFIYASQAFKVDEAPAKVDVDVIDPKEYFIKSVSTLDHEEYKTLTAINTAYRTGKIVGEIQNNNDYDIDSSVVTIIFRDNNGNLIGGTSTFVDSIKANSTIPFDISIYQKFATDNFEVYANIW